MTEEKESDSRDRMNPTDSEVKDPLTKRDIESFDYDVDKEFAVGVLESRSQVSAEELNMVMGLEAAADKRCFGEPRRCASDTHGEVLEVSLYGASLDVRGIQEFVKSRGDILLGDMFMVDDGWRPSRLVITVVDVQDNDLWA